MSHHDAKSRGKPAAGPDPTQAESSQTGDLVTGGLVILKQERRRGLDVGEVEPRYVRRLSDQITISFYEACRIGNLDAAQQLMQALECEVERSARLLGSDAREDGDDVAAVRARFELEVKRRHLEAAMGGGVAGNGDT